MNIKAVFGTDQGKKRKENQDVVLCSEELKLFAVSDGMGGVLCGKQAAEMSCTFLKMFFRVVNLFGMEIVEAENTIRDIVMNVSSMIQKTGNEGFHIERYGATLTGLCLHNEHAIIFNVGDSRVYLLRSGNSLQQMTRDDNLYELVKEDKDGIMTELDVNRLQNQLTQFMGMNEGIVPAIQSIKMKIGDRYLICSDGLTKMITDAEIQQILETERPLEVQVNQLIEKANEAGGKDNISAILLEIL